MQHFKFSDLNGDILDKYFKILLNSKELILN